MKNMKKILKEWRSFIKESTQPHPTSYEAQTRKYFDQLNKSTKVKKKEALRIEAGYNIIRAIRGAPDQKGFMKSNKEVTLSVLDQLLALSREYDGRLDREEDLDGPINQEDKLFNLYVTGALDGYAQPSYVVEIPKVPGINKSSFVSEGYLTSTLEILRNMINNDDYNFDLFKPGPNFVKLINNHGRGAGLGSIQTLPPQMSKEEGYEFLETPVAKEFARSWAVILDSRLAFPGVREHYENLLIFAKAAYQYYSAVFELWMEYAAKSKDRHDQEMITHYMNTIYFSTEYIEKIQSILSKPLTRQEEIDIEAEKARQGDREAAKKARAMVIAYKGELSKEDSEKNKEQIRDLTQQARTLRRIALGRG